MKLTITFLLFIIPVYVYCCMRTPVISEQPDLPLTPAPTSAPTTACIGCSACGSLNLDTPSYDEDCGMPIVTPCDCNNFVTIECINNCVVTFITSTNAVFSNKDSKEEYACSDSGKYFISGTNMEAISAYCV